MRADEMRKRKVKRKRKVRCEWCEGFYISEWEVNVMVAFEEGKRLDMGVGPTF